MNIRKISKEAVKGEYGFPKCIGCREHTYKGNGLHHYCNYVEDYLDNTYYKECDKSSLAYKTYLLLSLLEDKGITNLTIDVVDIIDEFLICGFGYKDIITKDNIDTKLSSIDEEYEKWYCRWVDAYSDELEDNKYTNGGYRK